eukprot:CAMPEP_0182490096 /NCGR_PEP_ID=MMETSP1321-20130603/73_1 /TAXON_ID=91990 /ORGANISM="Bolidomonas sp., Strain RCC1657" /LENGTH=488 /DNA_ID=CAMNT_0024692229 /DNA_START=38 /DNA_END=1504 /DNA_ORIENTATION=-
MKFDTSGGDAEAKETPNSLQIGSTSTSSTSSTSTKSNPTAAAETSSSHSTTTTSATTRHNDKPAMISNKTLGDLRREREERAVMNGRQLNYNQFNNQSNKTRDTSSNSEERTEERTEPNKSVTKAVTKAVTIDLTSDNDEDDDDDDDYAASVALAKKLSQPPSSYTSADEEAASEAASLALARSLSQHRPSAPSSSSSGEAASLALARLLSQEQQPLLSPSLPLPALYAHLKSDADHHRRSCEGPPTAPWTTVTLSDGTQQRLKRSPNGWLENHPVVSCTDIEILVALKDLGSPPPPNNLITTNKSNEKLMRLLCSWRKHVVSTKLETKLPGKDGFRSGTICTSEQTWLGRKTEKGGIIGVVAATTSTIDSLLAILNLKDEGAKATNAGFVMLIWLRLNLEGGVAAPEGVRAFEKRLKERKETDAARAIRLGSNHAAIIAGKKSGYKRLTGIECFAGTPWYFAFKDIIERRPVHRDLRHAILARAHLP